MTWDDVHKYLVPAIVTLYGHDLAEDAHALESLLGRNEYKTLCGRRNGHTPINTRYRAELSAIAKAGPHAKTILKIILIRKGLPHENI